MGCHSAVEYDLYIIRQKHCGWKKTLSFSRTQTYCSLQRNAWINSVAGSHKLPGKQVLFFCHADKEGLILNSINNTTHQIRETIQHKIESTFSDMLNSQSKVQLSDSLIIKSKLKENVAHQLMEDYWCANKPLQPLNEM